MTRALWSVSYRGLNVAVPGVGLALCRFDWKTPPGFSETAVLTIESESQSGLPESHHFQTAPAI